MTGGMTGVLLVGNLLWNRQKEKKTRRKNPETTWLQERLHRGDHRRVQHPPAWLDFCRLPPSWALTPWAFSFNLRQLSVTQNEKAVQVLRHGPQFYMAIFGVLKIYEGCSKFFHLENAIFAKKKFLSPNFRELHVYLSRYMLAKIFKKNMDVWYHDILKLFQASDPLSHFILRPLHLNIYVLL